MFNLLQRRRELDLILLEWDEALSENDRVIDKLKQELRKMVMDEI